MCGDSGQVTNRSKNYLPRLTTIDSFQWPLICSIPEFLLATSAGPNMPSTSSANLGFPNRQTSLWCRSSVNAKSTRWRSSLAGVRKSASNWTICCGESRPSTSTRTALFNATRKSTLTVKEKIQSERSHRGSRRGTWARTIYGLPRRPQYFGQHL